MLENIHDHAESIADKRMGPGILMLSPSMQLLYSDRRTWELFGRINKSQGGKATQGVLPPAVAELGAEIMKILQVRTDAKDWEQFRVKRVLGDPDRPILLRLRLAGAARQQIEDSDHGGGTWPAPRSHGGSG